MRLLLLTTSFLVGFGCEMARAEPLSQIQTPIEQANFMQAIQKYGASYQSAKNDFDAGLQRGKRAREICTALRSTNIKKWVGFVTDLSSNGDGYGVLSIEIGKGTTVGTWNNAFSDIGYNTLVKPTSKVAPSIAQLSVGQAVEFSGSFIKDKIDCVREKSVTLSGAMTHPEFLFRFSSVEKIGDTYVPKPESMLHKLLK